MLLLEGILAYNDMHDFTKNPYSKIQNEEKKNNVLNELPGRIITPVPGSGQEFPSSRNYTSY